MSVGSASRRVEALAGSLRDSILRGDFAAGDKLPAERDLAQRFGVGRSTVREAVGRLVQLGLVEVRHGGGATVRPVADANLAVLRHLLVLDGRLDRELVGQCLEVMEILLVAMLRFAVERATESEIARAQALLTRMRDPAIGDREYLDALEALTQSMAEASRQTALRLVRNGFREILGGRPAGRSGARLRPPLRESAPALESLQQALGARDVEAAVAAARRLMRAAHAQFMALPSGGERRDGEIA